MAGAAVHADAPRGRAGPPARRRLGPVLSRLRGARRAHRPARRPDAPVRAGGVLGWEKSRAVPPGRPHGRPGTGEEGALRLRSPRRLRGRHQARPSRSRQPRPATSRPFAACSSTGSRRRSSTPSATPPISCSPLSMHRSSPARHRALRGWCLRTELRVGRSRSPQPPRLARLSADLAGVRSARVAETRLHRRRTVDMPNDDVVDSNLQGHGRPRLHWAGTTPTGHGVFAHHHTDDVLVDWEGPAPTHGIQEHIDAMKAYVDSAGAPRRRSPPTRSSSGPATGHA